MSLLRFETCRQRGMSALTACSNNLHGKVMHYFWLWQNQTIQKSLLNFWWRFESFVCRAGMSQYSSPEVGSDFMMLYSWAYQASGCFLSFYQSSYEELLRLCFELRQALMELGPLSPRQGSFDQYIESGTGSSSSSFGAFWSKLNWIKAWSWSSEGSLVFHQRWFR